MSNTWNSLLTFNLLQDMFDMLKELGLFTLPFPEEREWNWTFLQPRPD